MVACGASKPTSRIEAYDWLISNWESVRPHATRLVELCERQGGEVVTAGTGTSALPSDVEEAFGTELRAAKANLVTCRSDAVRLDIGSGAEGLIDFYVAYFYPPAVVVEETPCNEAAFSRPGSGSCVTRTTDGWYIGIHWFEGET